MFSSLMMALFIFGSRLLRVYQAKAKVENR